MLDRIDDTIVAISSAPGGGRVGIVRLSGPHSLDIVDEMSAMSGGGSICACAGSRRVSGQLRIDGDGAIPASYYVFRAPRSYTRQDIVEIHTIGSPAVLELVRRRAIDLGALPAEPGEFTARAFLNGAMDLATAEAVAGVISAESDTQLRAARRMMDGSLAHQVTGVRDELAELLALVEADIDFAEEPIEFITPNVLRDRLAPIAGRLDVLLAGAASVERFDTLPRILLFGRPNVGKSTLMNRLSGTSRSICAAAAGTTRDVLSAPISLGRGEAILLDAAGVDESDDAIIARARAMVLSEAERVDLVCLVVDLSHPDLDRVEAMVRTLRVPNLVIAANKIDECRVRPPTRHRGGGTDSSVGLSTGWKARPTPEAQAALDSFAAWNLGSVIPVSALDGTGIGDLRSAFAAALGDQATTVLGESILISERQSAAIRDASASITRAVELSTTVEETIDCADLLAFELREALETLGTVTGDVTTEDLLGQVFARFCIGK